MLLLLTLYCLVCDRNPPTSTTVVWINCYSHLTWSLRLRHSIKTLSRTVPLSHVSDQSLVALPLWQQTAWLSHEILGFCHSSSGFSSHSRPHMHWNHWKRANHTCSSLFSHTQLLPSPSSKTCSQLQPLRRNLWFFFSFYYHSVSNPLVSVSWKVWSNCLRVPTTYRFTGSTERLVFTDEGGNVHKVMVCVGTNSCECICVICVLSNV